jgi:hypothetical protein
MHLWIDVSHSILQLPYLLQLAMQLLLQLAILVYLCTEPVVPKVGQRVVNLVLTHIVVMEDSHSLGCGGRGLLWCETQRGMSRSLVNRGPRGGHAQGIGVVGHVDGDVLCLDLAAIVYDLKGDIVRGYIEPELLQYARSLLQVRGASCCRRACSSSSTRRLSSPHTSLSRVYLHRCFFGHCVVHPSFVLTCSGFFVATAASEWGFASATRLVNSFHVMGVAKEDWEGITSAIAHGIPTPQAYDFVSEASPEGSDELTQLFCSSSALFCAVAVLPSVGTAATVRIDRCSPSIRRWAISSCSLLHSFVASIHANLTDFCSVAQLDSSSMGAVWQQSAGLWCREQGLGFANVVKGRDEDCIPREWTTSWRVDVVIVAVTVVLGESTVVAHDKGDYDARGIGDCLSGGGHGAVG